MAGFWTVILGVGGLIGLLGLTLIAVLVIVFTTRNEKEHPERKKLFSVLRIIAYFMLVPAVGLAMLISVLMIMK